MELLDRDDTDTDALGEVAVLAVIGRPPDADLHDAARVQQLFLDRAAEGGAVGVHRAAEIAVEKVRVAVEMDHAQRAVLGQRPQDGQAAQVIAARGQRHDPRIAHTAVEAFHPGHAVGQVCRVGGHVAQIGAVGGLEGPRPGRAVLGPDHGGKVAQLPRPVAGAGAVGGAAVPGGADQADLHILQARIVQGHMREPHEGGHTRKARQVETGDGLEEGIAHEAPRMS